MVQHGAGAVAAVRAAATRAGWPPLERNYLLMPGAAVGIPMEWAISSMRLS